MKLCTIEMHEASNEFEAQRLNLLANLIAQGHSLFDKLLVSDNGIWLKDLNNKGRIQNPEIVEFCTGVKGEVYIDGLYNNSTEKKNYKMYTPSNYENTKSLVYLDNEQSLMHYSLDK